MLVSCVEGRNRAVVNAFLTLQLERPSVVCLDMSPSEETVVINKVAKHLPPGGNN